MDSVSRLLRPIGIALVTVLVNAMALAAVAEAATYYSQGSVTPNTLANWNSVRAGGGSSPANFTSGDVFVIQDGHSMTTTAVWAVSGTGLYGRGDEWLSTTSQPGYPANVQVTNATTLNYPNGSTAARSMSGNLAIDAGAALYMDYMAPGLTNPLTVAGDVTLDGSLSLGDAIGGDLHLGGRLDAERHVQPAGPHRAVGAF